MHAFDRQTDRQTDGRTDGQTDGQTEIPSLYRDCIPCSAVKMFQAIKDTKPHLRYLMPPVKVSNSEIGLRQLSKSFPHAREFIANSISKSFRLFQIRPVIVCIIIISVLLKLPE